MAGGVGTRIPVQYDYMNLYNSSFSPSTVHVKNTDLQNFFRRYLLQTAISVFEWKLPETWCRDYFLYVLYSWGFIGVVNTDKYGVICQAGSLYGYDIYYQPTNMIITNPLLKGILQPRIGKDCTLFKLQPDYGSVSDLVNFYADLMALTAESAGINLLNSHLSTVFPAANKQQAESYKKLYDKVAGGEPAVAIDKTLFKEDGTVSWDVFQQNLKENYITSDLLSDLIKIKNMFCTDIGIPNSNTEKRERLVVEEVNANNVETRTRCELWLESLKESARKTNDMFGLDISVNWRNNPDFKQEVTNNVQDG